jgi:hypothetical protein
MSIAMEHQNFIDILSLSTLIYYRLSKLSMIANIIIGIKVKIKEGMKDFEAVLKFGTPLSVLCISARLFYSCTSYYK